LARRWQRYAKEQNRAVHAQGRPVLHAKPGQDAFDSPKFGKLSRGFSFWGLGSSAEPDSHYHSLNENRQNDA
jgi:hypothetical protein